MKQIQHIIILLLIPFIAIANNKTVTLFGNAPDYANINLPVKYKHNHITRSFRGLETFKVDKKGNFKVSFEISEITKIYIELGESVGYLYVTPGANYKIELPPYKPLKPENKLNPYFSPEMVLLGYTSNSNDSINKQVENFNMAYNSRFGKQIKKILITNNKSLAKDLIDNMEEEYPSGNNIWFNDYKNYTYITLKEFIYSNKKRKLIDEYFSNKPIQNNLDPYWDAFNQVFSHFFKYYFKSTNGEDLLNTWKSPNCTFDSLCISLSKDTLFKNRELCELVIIKSLYDSYYADNSNNNKIISLFTEAIEQCKTPYSKEIATEIQTKISKLRVGTQAPYFSFPTLWGKQKDLNSYEGKFIYLNFASTDNYACKKDFQLLDELSQLLKKDLRVVTILIDEDPEKAKKYIDANKYKWDFLHFNQNAKILMDYNIKAFPTYYLIDPDGNLVLSPSPSPEEDFAPVFSDKYNEYRYKKLRKEKPKSRTIYDL